MTDSNVDNDLDMDALEAVRDKLRSSNGGVWCAVKPSELPNLHGLGDATTFLMWLRTHKTFYTRKALEGEYKHVAFWISQGLAVARFTRAEYAALTGCSTRTVTNYIAKLSSYGFIRSVAGGTNTGSENAPLVVVVGLIARDGKNKHKVLFADWQNYIIDAAYIGDDKALKQLELIGWTTGRA